MYREENGRSEGIRTPDPMLPKHVRYQAALHSVRNDLSVFSRALVSSTSCIIQERARFVNGFFTLFCTFFASIFTQHLFCQQYLSYSFVIHIHIAFVRFQFPVFEA